MKLPNNLSKCACTSGVSIPIRVVYCRQSLLKPLSVKQNTFSLSENSSTSLNYLRIYKILFEARFSASVATTACISASVTTTTRFSASVATTRFSASVGTTRFSASVATTTRFSASVATRALKERAPFFRSARWSALLLNLGTEAGVRSNSLGARSMEWAPK